MEVRKISSWELTGEELSQLTDALGVSYQSTPLIQVLQDGDKDLVGFFRISGECAGIAALRVRVNSAGKELNIWLLGGKRLLFYLPTLDEAMIQIAKELGCTHIQADVTPRLAKVYERKMKLRPDMVSVWKEV